jgi:hypothetical protein
MSSEKIRQLQEEIRRNEERMRNCNHAWDKPFFNPETIREPSGYKFEVHGSDAWETPTSFHDVQKRRWTRKCLKCSFEEHTYEQKPIVTGYEPKFN